jgi:two-component system, chemotaxis family, chemotaxis protein CheY
MAESTGVRLLIAPDKPSERAVLAKVAGDAGFPDPFFAGDGKGVLEALQTGGVAAVLLDWGVASAGDFQLIKILGSRKQLSRIPLLVMAGGVDQDTLKAAVEAGAKHFLLKPFTPQNLRQKLALAAQQSTPPKKQGGPPVSEKQSRKHFLKGYDLLQGKYFSAAVQEFAQAVHHNKMFPEAYKGLAQALLGQGDRDSAAKFLGVAAETYVALERDKEAFDVFQLLHRDNPETPDPFALAAGKHQAEGNVEAAIGLYERGLAVRPDGEELVRPLAELLAGQGDTELAVNVLTSFLMDHGQEAEKAKALYLELSGEEWVSQHAQEADEEVQRMLAEAEARDQELVAGGKGVAGPGLEYEAPPDYDEKRASPRIPLADYFIRMAKQDPYLITGLSQTGLSFRIWLETEEEKAEAEATQTAEAAEEETAETEEATPPEETAEDSEATGAGGTDTETESEADTEAEADDEALLEGEASDEVAVGEVDEIRQQLEAERKEIENIFPVGQTIQFDIYAMEKARIKKLTVVIKHVTKGVVGCQFGTLDKKQKGGVDKIIISEAPEGFKLDLSNVSFDLDMGTW